MIGDLKAIKLSSEIKEAKKALPKLEEEQEYAKEHGLVQVYPRHLKKGDVVYYRYRDKVLIRTIVKISKGRTRWGFPYVIHCKEKNHPHKIAFSPSLYVWVKR